MSLIATELRYCAGGATLLDKVSLCLKPGRLTAVVGPNGAGKSTLLKLLSGEQLPQSGVLTLADKALHRWPRHELARWRAVVGQRDTLNFAFTAQEVVALGRLPHRSDSPARRRQLARLALTGVNALHLAPRHYPTLSGGERARVQLARAMVQIWEADSSRQRYLLLDEPTASQDLAHQHHCLQTVRNFTREGVGALVVLHDPNLVLDYADEVVVLCRGQVVAQGLPAEVLQADLLERVYGVAVRVLFDADSGRRWIQVQTDTIASPAR